MESRNDVLQNLKDAGCDMQTIEAFIRLGEEECRRGQIRLLEGHRRELLEAVHREQKRIDCVDYLLHQMKKENKNEKGERIS